jgi:hypothetical protein
MKTINEQKTKAIFSQEVKLNFTNELRLFIGWESESEYELSLYYNNKKYKAITSEVERVNYLLENNNNLSNKIAMSLVEQVQLNNVLEISNIIF